MNTPKQELERVEQLLNSRDWPNKPFVFEGKDSISLHFDIGATQSQMMLDEPDRLVLSYTRCMMGFLLFKPAPKQIGMIGLGGGSLAKFCHRYLTESHMVAVEINPAVVALRQQFHIPPDDERLQVLCEDGVDYVARQHGNLDVLLVDGFDVNGQAVALCSQTFFDHCASALHDDGVLVVNLSGNDPHCGRYIERLNRTFGFEVVVVRPVDCTNRVVFAVKGRGRMLSEAKLLRQARQLETQLPLSFQTVLQGVLANRRGEHWLDD